MDRVAKNIAEKHEFDLRLKPSASGFPDARIKGEAPLAELANFDHISIDFYKAPAPAVITLHSAPEYSLEAFCGTHKDLKAYQHTGIGLVFHLDIDISCKTDVQGMPKKDFQSYRDIDGAKVLIQVNMGSERAGGGQRVQGLRFPSERKVVTALQEEQTVCLHWDGTGGLRS